MRMHARPTTILIAALFTVSAVAMVRLPGLEGPAAQEIEEAPAASIAPSLLGVVDDALYTLQIGADATEALERASEHRALAFSQAPVIGGLTDEEQALCDDDPHAYVPKISIFSGAVVNGCNPFELFDLGFAATAYDLYGSFGYWYPYFVFGKWDFEPSYSFLESRVLVFPDGTFQGTFGPLGGPTDGSFSGDLALGDGFISRDCPFFGADCARGAYTGTNLFDDEGTFRGIFSPGIAVGGNPNFFGPGGGPGIPTAEAGLALWAGDPVAPEPVEGALLFEGGLGGPPEVCLVMCIVEVDPGADV